jgi:hypothetical protein
MCAAGCLSTALVTWSTATVGAQKILLDPVTSIHVCVTADGLLRLVDMTATCPQAQKSLFLKKAEADIDVKDQTQPQDSAKKSNPNTVTVDKSRLAALEQRIAELEGAVQKGDLGNKVVAPFEVVNRSGKRVFYVEQGFVRFYNSAETEVALIRASTSGGSYVARSTTEDLRITVGAGELNGAPNAGMVMRESGVDRISLARRGERSYVAIFQDASGNRVAGIGQSQAGRGATYVADARGTIRAVMRIGEDDSPIIAVTNGDPTIAALMEGEAKGGKLLLFDASGHTPMVAAGATTDGVGVVRTGPEGFKPGLGVLGLPSSFLIGK